jgi:hypothetical protein
MKAEIFLFKSSNFRTISYFCEEIDATVDEDGMTRLWRI